MAISAYLSTITLNINRLNAPIKRHWVAEWIKKQDASTCCLQETHFVCVRQRLESEGMEKDIASKQPHTASRCSSCGWLPLTLQISALMTPPQRSFA